MNDTPAVLLPEAQQPSSLDLRVACVLAQPGVRAAMVTQAGAGLSVTPVEHGKSVVNIGRDLLDHLNAMPFEDAWLEALAAYCTERLAARAGARRSGGIVTPNPHARWDLQHFPGRA